MEVRSITTALIVAGSLLLMLLGAFGFYFNRLIRLRNRVDNAWRQIDVELNRRHNLIPRLLSIVEGYAAHEQETLEDVASARVRGVSADSVGEQSRAENCITEALGHMFLVVESYPQLKANQDFMEFQQELARTENNIAGSRKYYNGAVMYYDNARESFPGNVVAKLLPRVFGDREYFEFDVPGQRTAPEPEGLPR